MKPTHKPFSRGWRKQNQIRIMVLALFLLILSPFLLYQAMINANALWIGIDSALIVLGMLLIIFAS